MTDVEHEIALDRDASARPVAGQTDTPDAGDSGQDQRIKAKADRRRAVLLAVGDFQRARRRAGGQAGTDATSDGGGRIAKDITQVVEKTGMSSDRQQG